MIFNIPVLLFCLFLCLFTSMSYGFECITSHKTGSTENCPTVFGNRDRIFCCEQLDGTGFCCDYDEYIRNRRRRIENARKAIGDGDMEYPWWLLDWIMYIVPVMPVCLCIICCVCNPCCKQRRRGFVYRIQQPTAIVNVQPCDPTSHIPPLQTNMSMLPPSPVPGPVPMPLPQYASASLPLVHNPSYTQPHLSHNTFDEPPPYYAVVSDMDFKQVP